MKIVKKDVLAMADVQLTLPSILKTCALLWLVSDKLLNRPENELWYGIVLGAIGLLLVIMLIYSLLSQKTLTLDDVARKAKTEKQPR